MKPQYFIAALFLFALYWMFFLYKPFLMSMTIAILLAMSTLNVQNYFEKRLNSKLFASIITSFLLAVMFFGPFGYIIVSITSILNSIDNETIFGFEKYIKDIFLNPPEFLSFAKPYFSDIVTKIDLENLASKAIALTTKIGAFSVGFIKNAFLIIVFYFFVNFYKDTISQFLKRVVQIDQKDADMVESELSSVMGVVFYSIIVTAAFEGALFGLAVGFMGYDGLLYGILFGFASLVPVVGAALMWVPFMSYEFYLGNSTNAIFIALYTVIVISIIADTFIKPIIIKEINKRLLSKDSAKLNELVIFFAIIAGLSTFGFWGMILGPAITSFFLTILKLVEARTKEEVINSHKYVDNHS